MGAAFIAALFLLYAKKTHLCKMQNIFGRLYDNLLITIEASQKLNIYQIDTDKFNLVKTINFNFPDRSSFRTFEYLEEKNLLIIGRDNGMVQFIDLTTEKVQKEIKLPLSDDYFLGENLDMLQLSNNRKWLAVGQVWYTAYPINLENFEVKEMDIPAQPLKIKYSFDDNYVAVLHGEQGGQGLAVYKQTPDGEWIEVYEHWAITDFEFSKVDCCIYHFDINDKKVVLKKVNLVSNNRLEWENTFSIPQFENYINKTIDNPQFDCFSMLAGEKYLELTANNTLTTIDIQNGQMVSTKKYDSKIIEILSCGNRKILLAIDRIIRV
jgi:hypothetical protein